MKQEGGTEEKKNKVFVESAILQSSYKSGQKKNFKAYEPQRYEIKQIIDKKKSVRSLGVSLPEITIKGRRKYSIGNDDSDCIISIYTPNIEPEAYQHTRINKEVNGNQRRTSVTSSKHESVDRRVEKINSSCPIEEYAAGSVSSKPTVGNK